MDKYNEIHRAAICAQNMGEMPVHVIKNFSNVSYTSDNVLYKKDSQKFPKEILNVIEERGNIGLVDGLSLVWGSSRGKLVFWNFSSLLLHEVEIQEEIFSVQCISPRREIFLGNVQACFLLFSEKRVSLMCYCNNPIAFVDMNMSAELPVPMGSMCEISEGRVILGGMDGNIYELVYGNTGWFKGGVTIHNHTSGFLSSILPFFYAMGRRASVIQLVSTKRGALAMYEDRSIDAFEIIGSSFKKVRMADLSSLALKKDEKIQLFSINGAGYEACLVREDGTRVFLDNCGVIVGSRPLPHTRNQKSRGITLSSITKETFFNAGRHMVIVGYRGEEGIVTVVTPNREAGGCAENCCTIPVGNVGYAQAGRIFSGSFISECSSETLLKGEELALLGQKKIDTYQIMDGVEFLERASTSPEGLYSFRQRNGVEHTLLVCLYAISNGISSSAIDNLFKKSPSLYTNAITLCLGVILQNLWNIDLRDVISGKVPGGACAYVRNLEHATARLKKLKTFVQQETIILEALVVDSVKEITIPDMISDSIETLHYISLLLETDLKVVLDSAEARAGEHLLFSIGMLMAPNSQERIHSLEALIELHLRQKNSIDAIAASLNSKCPTLFAYSDTLFIKGKTLLEKSKEAISEEDKTWHLEKSLSFFQRAAKTHLPFIITEYAKAGFSKGILQMLKITFTNADAHKCIEYFSMVDCTEEFLREGLLDKRSAFCKALLDSVVERIQNEVLSIDVLLQVKSPYIEEYLDHLENISTETKTCDLAWKYHMKNGNYYLSLLYLIKASERSVPFTTLQKRIEYLALACTMHGASSSQENQPPTGKIKEYVPSLSTSPKERLAMAQRQADIMAAIATEYHPQNISYAQEMQFDEIFERLEKGLLGYEELFEICVMFGFSLLALSIARVGEIENEGLLRNLWEDALAGEYDQALCVLQKNREITVTTSLDLLLEILIEKRFSVTSGENLGKSLALLGFHPVTIARVLEIKASSPEYSEPHKKRIILQEAIDFAEDYSMADIANRLISIRTTLGL
ncbi:nuclear pore complex protein Nup155 [Nematocida sp. LUAm3]|nr:nuclear pore complex protein Nup155 [Nematocida sp. LUAm3]KAI5176249.1 nuclear pore complex protein Nup155 [Nematocida sp. LUAm2]KAI5176707.1 nuclear pore complex protein Nup155 [Nematocida sp. LUAm1]